MSRYLKDFSEKKNEEYSKFFKKVTPTFEVERYDFESIGLEKAYRTEPGFFTPYRSTAEFINHIKTPMMLPLISLKETIKHLMSSINQLVDAFLHLVDLRKDDTSGAMLKAAADSATALLYLGSIFYDAVREVFALLCRTSASAVLGTIETGKNIANLMQQSQSNIDVEYFKVEYKNYESYEGNLTVACNRPI